MVVMSDAGVPMSGQQLADLYDRPVPAWAVAGAAVLAAVLLLAVRLRRPVRVDRGRRLETVLTVAAAGIATGVSASGMWRVFGDALGMSGPARVAVFGFVELAVAVSAIRARRALRETGSTGVDGAAVWVLAGLSAVLSALDARSGAEVLLRLAAPLVAAWLWERGLAPDRRQLQVRRRRGPVSWRVTRERVLVWLRLAEPAERAVAEVDRARKVARLTRAAWRYHSLTAAGAAGWRVRRAAAVLRRQTLASVEHLALGEDDEARDAVRRSLATLYQVTAGTAPDALAHLTPWSDPLAVQRPTTVRPVEPAPGPVEASTGPAVQRTDASADRTPVWSVGPGGGTQTDRAHRAAIDHRAAHGTLPTTTELVGLTGVSRGTAGTVLKGLRTPTTQTLTSTHAADESDQTQRQHEPPAGQSEPTHDEQPTHPPSKIQNEYTPMHHDPVDRPRATAGR
jgi:hypothetical protein